MEAMLMAVRDSQLPIEMWIVILQFVRHSTADNTGDVIRCERATQLHQTLIGSLDWSITPHCRSFSYSQTNFNVGTRASTLRFTSTMSQSSLLQMNSSAFLPRQAHGQH